MSNLVGLLDGELFPNLRPRAPRDHHDAAVEFAWVPMPAMPNHERLGSVEQRTKRPRNHHVQIEAHKPIDAML